MPPLKSLLRSHEVRPAGQMRDCWHNGKHKIPKGVLVLEVRSGLHEVGGYCRECALKMVEVAEERLKVLRTELG